MNVLQLRVKEAAERLRVSRSTIYRWARRGRLRTVTGQRFILVEVDFQAPDPPVGSGVDQQPPESAPTKPTAVVPDVSSPGSPAAVALTTASIPSNQAHNWGGAGQRGLAFNWRTYYRLAF